MKLQSIKELFIMKKLLAIVLCLVFCLSLVACGGGGDPEAVAAYVEANKAAILSGFASTGLDMDAEVKAEGTGIVVSLSSSMYDGFTDAQTEAAEAQLDSMSEMYDTILEALKKECSDIGSLTYELCDSTGRVVVSLVID